MMIFRAFLATWIIAGYFTNGGTAPVNDAFTNRIHLSRVPATLYGSTLDATEEPTEGFLFHIFSTVWFSWTAPSNTNLRLAVEATDFFPFIHVFTGADLSSLSYVGGGSGNFPARISAEAGVEYHFRIGADAPWP